MLGASRSETGSDTRQDLPGRDALAGVFDDLPPAGNGSNSKDTPSVNGRSRDAQWIFGERGVYPGQRIGASSAHEPTPASVMRLPRPSGQPREQSKNGQLAGLHLLERVQGLRSGQLLALLQAFLCHLWFLHHCDVPRGAVTPLGTQCTKGKGALGFTEERNSGAQKAQGETECAGSDAEPSRGNASGNACSWRRGNLRMQVRIRRTGKQVRGCARTDASPARDPLPGRDKS